MTPSVDTLEGLKPPLMIDLIFFVGVTWGYLVDMAGITPRTPLGNIGPTIWQEEPQLTPVGESPLDDLSREVPEGLGYKILHPPQYHLIRKY